MEQFQHRFAPAGADVSHQANCKRSGGEPAATGNGIKIHSKNNGGWVKIKDGAGRVETIPLNKPSTGRNRVVLSEHGLRAA